MRLSHQIIRRVPAATIGLSATILSTGIVLSTILILFEETSLYAVQLTTLIGALALISGIHLSEKFDFGLPITRHEIRLVGIASIVSTWLMALLAILASQRHISVESNWIAHLTTQFLLTIVIPFGIRCLTGWYARTFWTGKVSNAMKAAGVVQDQELEKAARNYALPETLAWAVGGAWALGTVISNMPQTARWDDGTIYSTVVTAMTTFGIAYYYSHPDQKSLRKIIKGHLSK